MGKHYTDEEINDLLKDYTVVYGPEPNDEPGSPDEMAVQVPFCGLYNSPVTAECDRQEEYELDYIHEVLQSGEADPSDFHLGEWEMDMASVYDCWIECVQVEVKERTGIDVNMRFHSIISPREYNFYSDLLIAWVDKKGMRKLINYVLADPALSKTLEEEVRDVCTPSSGYVPLHDEREFDWSRDDLPDIFYELIFKALTPDWYDVLLERWWDKDNPEFYPAGELEEIYKKRQKEGS